MIMSGSLLAVWDSHNQSGGFLSSTNLQLRRDEPERLPDSALSQQQYSVAIDRISSEGEKHNQRAQRVAIQQSLRFPHHHHHNHHNNRSAGSMFHFTPLLGTQSDSHAHSSLLELDGGIMILVDVGWDEKFDVGMLKAIEK